MGNGALTAVIIIAVIVCAAFAGAAVLLRKIRNSPELEVIRYAAKAIQNGDINDRISTTPKSLSNMEKIFLPQILKDFPEFNWNEFKPLIQTSICSLLRAIDMRDRGPVAGNPKLREAVEQMLAGTQIPHYKDVKVHDTVIKRYYKQEGTCCILCESAVEYYTYIEENDKVVSGYKDRKRQEVYETELVYVQDAERAGKAAGAKNAVSGGSASSGLSANSAADGAAAYTGAATRFGRAANSAAGGAAAYTGAAAGPGRAAAKMTAASHASATGIGVTCPNCGAPITSLGAKRCEYCGTAIEPLNLRVWKINAIRLA